MQSLHKRKFSIAPSGVVVQLTDAAQDRLNDAQHLRLPTCALTSTKNDAGSPVDNEAAVAFPDDRPARHTYRPSVLEQQHYESGGKRAAGLVG